MKDVRIANNYYSEDVISFWQPQNVINSWTVKSMFLISILAHRWYSEKPPSNSPKITTSIEIEITRDWHLLSNKLNITCYFYFHRCCNLCWRLKLPIPVVQYATVLESLQESSFFVNRTEFDFGTTHPNDFQWLKKNVF